MPSANLTIPCKIYEDPYKVKSVILPEYGINPAKADVTEQDVVSGKKFYKSDGSLATGSLILQPDPVTDEGYYGLRAQTHNDHNLSELKKIVGCSFGWNQIAQFPNRTNISSKGITFTVSDGVLTYSGTPTESTGYVEIVSGTFANFISGHKYLIRVVDSNGDDGSRKTYVVINNPYVEIPSSESNAKRYVMYAPTDTPTYFYWRLSLVNLATDTQISGKAWVQAFDLTVMFGSTIADYIYGLGNTDGVALFKTFFNKNYYPYNAGTLISTHPRSHRMVGFNKFNPHNVKFGENSNYSKDPGTTLTTSGGESYATVSGDNPVEVEIITGWKGVLFTVDDIVPGVLHKFEGYLDADNTDSIRGSIYLTDDNYVVIRKISNVWYNTGLISYSFTPTASETKFVYAVESSTANNTITLINPCVHIATNSALDGKYDAYSVADYAFYDTDLNGVPKLVDNKIVYDGDEYTPDGAIVRKYGIVDLGLLSWTKRDTSEGHWRFTTQDILLKWNSSTDAIGNMICLRYQSISANGTWNGITGVSSHTTMTQLLVCDETYSDAATFKAAMSGVYLVYELQYPILESRSAYSEKQALFQNGTEEFVDDRAISIPVWHETEYIQYVEYINPDPVEEMPSNDVNFIDYDGKIIKSYSKNDFLNLYALPPNPVHSGLISQGWNWTLSDAKEYVRMAGYLDIGQNYDTDDYSIRIYINIYEKANTTVSIRYRLGGSGGYGTIDWGDGTINAASVTSVFMDHTYSSIGNYVIKINIPDGSYGYGYGTSRSIIYGNACRILVTKIEFSSRWRADTSANFGNEANTFRNLEAVTIPRKAYGIDYFRLSANMFVNCSSLKAIVIPPGAYIKGASVLDACYSLKRISVPKSTVDNVMGGNYIFRNCYSLKRFAIPSGQTSLTSTFLGTALSLSKIVIPSSITSIAASAFTGCTALKEIHFKRSTPPSVANSNAWTSLPTDCKIYVPSGKLSAYTGATNYPSSSTYTYIEE